MNVQKVSLNTNMPVRVSDSTEYKKCAVPKLVVTNGYDTVLFKGKHGKGRKTLQAFKAAVRAAEKKAEELAEDLGLVTVKELPA